MIAPPARSALAGAVVRRVAGRDRGRSRRRPRRDDGGRRPPTTLAAAAATTLAGAGRAVRSRTRARSPARGSASSVASERRRRPAPPARSSTVEPRRRRLAGRAGQLVVEREPAELEQQHPEVAGVEQLDPDVRVQLAQPAQLAVLLAHELLLERRELDVQLEVGQVEVGREALDDVAVEVPGDRERVRLVRPADLVEVEDPGELRLARVGERGPRTSAGAGSVTRRLPAAVRRRGACAGRRSSPRAAGASR